MLALDTWSLGRLLQYGCDIDLLEVGKVDDSTKNWLKFKRVSMFRQHELVLSAAFHL